MRRSLEVLIDAGSWAPNAAPSELLTNTGSRQANVLAGLIYTALVTRPPIVHGFHLSDYWAWLRYLPAIAATNELRLREEWGNVDSHQKAVLSDELGVGFTTQFIAEVFDCLEFTDTLYVVNVLRPASFSLKREARRGPRKSPDYIARDRQSGYIVLECKGSQTSRTALMDAIVRGRDQKRNVTARQPTHIVHSLVAGLFIPQWSVNEGPCIYVCDPHREELEGLLFEEPRERIDCAITQIGLAKQFALAGLAAVPTYLGLTGLGDFGERPEAVRAEIYNRTSNLKDDYRVVFDSASLRARAPQAEMETRVKFSVRTPVSILDQLVGTTPIAEVISEMSERSLKSSWEVRSDDLTAELASPLGFGFRLELETKSLIGDS